jgi:DNA-binding FrmR family transcriptional regulator
MSRIDKEKQKLVARIKRIRGQVDSIKRSLTTGDDCADVLMLLANVRGGVNSLFHMIGHEKTAMPSAELAEDPIGLVRAYLK